MSVRIAIGADHAGFQLKQQLAKALRDRGHEVDDLGTHSEAPVDYPDFAGAVAESVARADCDRGIFVCGTGIGPCMVANRVPGVRAAAAHDEYTARMSRAHQDANVLCLGARVTGPGLAEAILDAWLETPFEGGRHQRRVEKIHTRDVRPAESGIHSVRPGGGTGNGAGNGGGMGNGGSAGAASAAGAPLPAAPHVRSGPPLEAVDPEIAEAVAGERRRQAEVVDLIASENLVSRAVLEAEASLFTNKYAEGYPGRRYYGGCRYVDVVEDLARDRAKALFGAGHANVQPHSGAQANTAAYAAFLEPGDVVLGMNLAQGGHLTHGAPVTLTGKLYRFVAYGVDPETERIDMDAVRAAALEHRPKLIVAGATAYSRVIDFAAFRAVADEVGALLMVDMAHIAGLVAAGVHPSPVPHADIVTTTTHKTLRGPRGGLILSRAEHARDVDRAVFPGVQGGPLVHVIAAKAVCLKEAATPEFRAYQARIVENARALAGGLARRGFRLVAGGTDNHLMLVDLRPKGMTGADAEAALDAVGIIVNKNLIPYDPEKPRVTSGIRIGTPSVTTRGMGPAEMDAVAGLIDEALEAHRAGAEPRRIAGIRERVRELCSHFPIPGL